MVQEQGIIKGNALQKISGSSLIIGAILLIIGNILLLVYFPDLNSIEKQPFFYQITTIVLACGIWALMIGMAGIYRFIKTAGIDWVCIGFYFILLATTFWTICLTIDIALGNIIVNCDMEILKKIVQNWNNSYLLPENVNLNTIIFVTLLQFDRVFYSSTIFIHGIAYSIICGGIIVSNLYTRWIGWVGLFISIVLSIIGILWIFNDKNWGIFKMIFMIPSLLITLWTLILGILTAKNTWQKV